MVSPRPRSVADPLALVRGRRLRRCLRRLLPQLVSAMRAGAAATSADR